MGVVGAALRGFGKALKSRGRKPGVLDRTTGKPFPPKMQKKFQASAKRKEGMKKEGYKQEPYILSGKKSKTGAHKLKEMWSYDPHKMPKPSKLKKILKDQRTKGLATGAVIGGAYKLGEEKGKGKK